MIRNKNAINHHLIETRGAVVCYATFGPLIGECVEFLSIVFQIRDVKSERLIDYSLLKSIFKSLIYLQGFIYPCSLHMSDVSYLFE